MANGYEPPLNISIFQLLRVSSCPVVTLQVLSKLIEDARKLRHSTSQLAKLSGQ